MPVRGCIGFAESTDSWIPLNRQCLFGTIPSTCTVVQCVHYVANILRSGTRFGKGEV